MVSPHQGERPELVVMSARSAAALDDGMRRLAAHLIERPEVGLTDVAFSLATDRSQLDHRIGLVARSRDELIGLLESASSGASSRSYARGAVESPRPKLA